MIGPLAHHPDRELMAAIQRDKVAKALAASPASKFWDGLELFEEACRRMKSGIRGDFPGLDEAAVDQELRRRLDLVRRRDRGVHVRQ